jgi:hypothetical protein
MNIELLAARVSKLESSSRRWKWTAGALSFCLLTLLSISATTQQALPAKLDNLSVNTLTVHKINVTDGENFAGIVLSADQHKASIIMMANPKLNNQASFGGNVMLFAGEDDSGFTCTLPSERLEINDKNFDKINDRFEGFSFKNTRDVSSMAIVRDKQASLLFMTQPNHAANLMLFDADKHAMLHVP